MKLMRSRHIATLALGHDEENPVGHPLADDREKAPVQVGPAPFSRARVHVKSEERIPMRLA